MNELITQILAPIAGSAATLLLGMLMDRIKIETTLRQKAVENLKVSDLILAHAQTDEELVLGHCYRIKGINDLQELFNQKPISTGVLLMLGSVGGFIGGILGNSILGNQNILQIPIFLPFLSAVIATIIVLFLYTHPEIPCNPFRKKHQSDSKIREEARLVVESGWKSNCDIEMRDNNQQECFTFPQAKQARRENHDERHLAHEIPATLHHQLQRNPSTTLSSEQPPASQINVYIAESMLRESK